MKESIQKITLLLLLTTVLYSCIEEPVKEDVPELITKVILTFSPTNGGNAVEAIAVDPDGEGIQDLETNGAIVLEKGIQYALSISLINELADKTSPDYNITDEVEEEGNEHMIFFEWTGALFTSPPGNGNIDNRTDQVNYLDADSNSLPIGLSTDWLTIQNSASGTFRMVLKHQPALKSASSTSDMGETDLDVTFNLVVE